jgi:DNA-binding NarL/FixJ family response regulator
MSVIRVALCDRHALVRSAFQSILQAQDDLDVVWSAGTLAEARSLGASAPPDVLLLDFTDPTPAFLAEVQEFRKACPNAQLVGLTDHGADACRLFVGDGPVAHGFGQKRSCCLQQAFMIGAKGGVRKTSTPEELLRVIRSVAAGRIAVEEPSLSLLLARLFGKLEPEEETPHLTEREREVVLALAEGKSNKVIAAALGISEQTVKNHISHILEKLVLEHRLQIVILAARQVMITFEPNRAPRG